MIKITMRLIVVLTWFGLVAPAYAGMTNAVDRVFTVGVVPQFEIRKLYSIWLPIIEAIEAQTGYKMKLKGTQSISQFERSFANGEYDFAYMNPYHLLIAHRQAGYRPLIRDHGRQLFGVLVVRKDSHMQSPQQLNGRVVAFPSPNALGASLQMRQELHDKFDVTPVARYVKSHDAVFLNVLTGLAVAGGAVQKTLNRQAPAYRDLLEVIYTTDKVAPHPFAVHPDVPAEVADSVRDALLQLGQTGSGRELLANIPIKQIGVASLADYEPLMALGLDRFYVTP